MFFVVAYITDEREPMMTVGASIALTIGAAYIIFYLWSWRKEQRTVVGEGAAWLVVALLVVVGVLVLQFARFWTPTIWD